MKEISNGLYKIRPSARLITTIGENLIKDTFAAIVELVKNSYDADASEVVIEFSNEDIENENMKLKIIISDDGHGMDLDTVINKWMVPATNDKYERVISPKGRVLQGRKGIGRYAVALLGEEFKLSTVDEVGKETDLEINWNVFNDTQYLEELDIPIRVYETNRKKGTNIEIKGGEEKLLEWSKESIEILINELSKLISPINNTFGYDKESIDKFNIRVKFKDFFVKEYENDYIDIEPVDLIELYDYRLYGTINKDSEFDLIFIDNVSGMNQTEEIKLTNIIKKECSVGDIKIDFRIFDRDPESIENIISKGLKDKATGEYFGKNEARNHLNKMAGIGIYRGGFKVRPYGDAGYDWLELDKLRVQTPSKKLGSNQVIGFVEIESEDNSNLQEKSARDGLKENSHYNYFKELLRISINELEIRRFQIRKATGRGRSKTDLGKQLNNLFSFDNLTKKIENVLSDSVINKSQLDLVIKHIQEEEESKIKDLKRIEEIIAMYQGQATLGRVMMIVMHEARKPLHWFKNQSKLMRKYMDKYKDEKEEFFLNKIEIATNNYENQTDILVDLFKKLQPLAISRSKKQEKFKIIDAINESTEVFESKLSKDNISIIIEGNTGLDYFGWKNDFIAIFTNLIENSIYWLNIKDEIDKKIYIKIRGEENLEYIRFKDNGPGISEKNIKSHIIFEPEFSTKYTAKGSGLGLAIAGEASDRNNIELTARYYMDGAYFVMRVKEVEEKINE